MFINRTPLKKTTANRDAVLNRETGSPVEVFCRLRPLPEGECETCIKVLSATELVLFSPEGFKNGVVKESHYEFSHILTDCISQKAAFKELCLPLIDDLIQGKSSVLFTYGITGSGKTFTMMGPLNNPGLIPRSFDLLRSDRQNGYEILSESDIVTERSRKEIFSKGQRIKAPQSKQLREDARGRPYIKDVKEIEVRSAEEAIELLNIGLKRRRIAHTQLNTESSRSHSVLSLRLVQFHADIPPTSLTRDDLTVSQIHLVDLAGSERVNRAKTAGDRVKEASNINSSLMVLRQCFETLRENQAQGINKMVPYRDAKLTSFFKSYFDGEGKIRMILCVNPAVDGYEEIQHALKFGDLTKDVVVPRAPAPVPLRNRNILREIVNSGSDTVSNQAPSPTIFQEFYSTALVAPFPPFEYSIETDEDTINNLQNHLTKRIEERRRLTAIIHEQEEYLRKYILELSTEYDQYLAEHDELKKENEQQSKTIKHLQTRIKLLEKSQNDYVKTNSNYERDIKTLKSQIEERNNEIKQLKADRRKDKNDFENKIRVKMMDVEQQHLNELRNKDLQMKELERQHEDKLNIIRSMAGGMSDQPTSLTTTRIAHAEFAQIQTNVQVFDIENNNPPAAGQSLDMMDRIQHHRVEMMIPRGIPIEQIPIVYSDSQGQVVAHPRQQHRRSRSSGEVWFDHRPQGTLTTETLLQPQFSKKVIGLQPEKDDIVRTTKYVLTHQNLDSDGEIVTDLVKGDVLQSVGGGANVIFNDVERLTCKSPPNPLVIQKRAKSEERLLQETRTPKSPSRQPPEVPPKRFRI
ncbi:unnamed protein product [Didymodactylos carnosus]|uniref:Kinesin-like protein n=1 Tax=Didymodactylos carnosus TaxID=1234261 RepID=A0A815GUT2_9BILA|nr:unnamed protein product [Didymodactylos carnosus]CAF4206687.1 unnamed protein product [Didymodactylos carnosus]